MDIYERAVAHWGAESQRNKLLEECGELITAVIRASMGRTDKSSVEEELADVEIMLAQMRLTYDGGLVDDWKRVKLRRLEQRLTEEGG